MEFSPRHLAVLRSWLFATFALAMVLLQGCSPPEAEDSASDAEAVSALTLVRTTLPAVEDVVDSTVLAADVLPNRRATLAAEVGGSVESLHFGEGDRVRKGTVLAQVDTRAIEQGVAEAEAVARQTEIAFATATRLLEQRAITNSQMLEAATSRDVARARVEGARLQLEKSKLAAPWSGRISRKLVEVGDFVGPGQPIAVLIDDSVLKVRASATASDVPYLKVGAPVSVTVDGMAEVFETKISRLGSELDFQSRSLAFESTLPNDGQLKPGMIARLTMPRQALTGVVLLPLAALVEIGESSAVYVVSAGRAERRMVDLGPILGDRVVIRAGVEPTDHVVIEGRMQIAPGQVVDEQFEAVSP